MKTSIFFALILLVLLNAGVSCKKETESVNNTWTVNPELIYGIWQGETGYPMCPVRERLIFSTEGIYIDSSEWCPEWIYHSGNFFISQQYLYLTKYPYPDTVYYKLQRLDEKKLMIENFGCIKEFDRIN